MEQPSWASGADDSGAPSPALPSLGDLPAAGSRPQRVHYSLYTDFAPAYRSQPRKPPRRERAQLPTPAWRAPHAGWDASVSQDGTFDATLLSDPRASQASVRRASATTASAAMSEDLFDASARTYAAEAKGRQRRHHRRDACKRGEAVLRRAQLRLDEGRLNEAASALEEARQYFKRGRGLSRLQQVTSMQERLRGDAMVVRAEAALVAHAYDEHVAALTKAAWHFGYFFDGRLEEASNAVELAEDQRRKAAVADILSRTRDVAFAQAKECITASLDALDRFDTLAANAQLEAARRSYDWLEYDASEALDAVRVRIARVSDQSTAAIEIERVVRGSQGRTRTVLLRLRQLMEELRDMDHCQDSPAADVEAMELNIERSMNGLVQPLISEKAQHSKEYLNRVLNVLDDEEAIIDVLGMIEHKSHSAVFCSCCLMFLDVMFSIEQEKAFNMHNELLSRHHAFVVRSVVHCMLQHPGVPDIRTAVVQLLAFIFTFYPAIDADTATGDLLAQKETVSIIIAMYDEDHKSAAGVHEVALVATAALLRLICTTEERVLLIAAEDGFRKLVRAMKHHIEESEMPGGGGRASGGGAPRLNSIGEGSIGSEPAAEARQATRAAALVVKPPGQFQSRRTSVTHMLQRRISETESRTYRTTMGVQSPQALVERKTRALQKSISHSKLTSGATAAIAHNTRGMQLLNTVARCCRAPLHDFVAAHDVCQVAELAVLNAPGATQLHAQAARLLLYLTSSEHEAAYLLQTKGVETMVLMHSHNRGFDANENVLVHCCRALTCLLAENEVSAEAFKQIDATGGVSEVCDALRSKEARNFAQYAVAALDVLAKAAPWLNAAGEGEEPGTRDRRRQEALDACQAVLTAMARFATVHDVQLRATEAMLALCSTSEECADVLLQGGALGGLIAALRRFEGRHELMELTIASASVLGRRDGAIEQLNALGCGTLLSFILCKFVSSAPIVRSSLALLLTILQQWGDLVELVLRIDNAKELATGMTGDISDPHCVVFWNGRRVGQTSVIQNDPNPIWDDEQFTVMIPPTVSDCTLRVEVRLGDPYDNDLGGELRGQVFFDGKQLEAWLNCAQLEAQKQSDGVIAWDTQCEAEELIEHHLCVETKQFALQRKMDSGEIQLVQGSLGVRVNCLQPSAIIFAMTQNLADASIQVGACKALTELADTPDQVVDIIEAGGVNALVRALETHKLCLDRQDGAESGRTDVFYSAASLAAAKEAAEMPTKASAEVLEEALSTMRHLLKIGPKDTMELVLEFSTGEHAAAATGFVLRIEVRDFDCEGVLGDLLGEVVLTGEELMRIAEEEADRTASSGQMLPVTEKPFELQRKELSNERQLVQGSINLKIQLVELSSCVVSVYRRQASVLRSFADADQGAAYVQQRMTGAKKLLDEGVLCLARLATVREAVVPIERAEGVVAVLDAIRTVPRLLSVEHTASAMQFLKRVADQSMMRVAEITFISAAGLARADAGKVDRVLLGSTLRCEVRDFDYDHSAFLGHITVSGRELCNLVYAASSDREEYTHPLTRNRQASEKQFVSGDMTFKVGVRDGPGSEYVVSCETIACVLESLDVHSSDGDILRHGLALLRCIVDSDEKLQRVLTSGDVFAVLRHAQQACTHEAAARGIAFLLVELLKRPECREHIDESVLAETFRRFSDNPGWIEHARDVLALIANVKSTPGFFSFSLQFLGVPATVRCARCHEDDESLQQAVALALLRLTSSDDDAQALVRERALDVLLAAMRRFPQNAEIIEHARQLWKEVDRYCGRNKELAIDVGNLECVDDFKQAAGL
eukprot:g939.t1